jgi:hypothetical protein
MLIPSRHIIDFQNNFDASARSFAAGGPNRMVIRQSVTSIQGKLNLSVGQGCVAIRLRLSRLEFKDSTVKVDGGR